MWQRQFFLETNSSSPRDDEVEASRVPVFRDGNLCFSLPHRAVAEVVEAGSHVPLLRWQMLQSVF